MRLKFIVSILMVLVLIFPLAACGTVTNSTWKLEKREVIRKMKEILDKTDPELVKEINEILDKMNTAGFFVYMSVASWRHVEVSILSEMKEIRFLIEKSDISVPLMLGWLANKKSINDEPLLAYFFVFGEVKNAESIPFLIDYLISLPEDCRKEWSILEGPFAYGMEAVMKITGKGTVDYSDRRELLSLFDQRFEIAKQAKKWYLNHKKTHP